MFGYMKFFIIEKIVILKKLLIIPLRLILSHSHMRQW